MNYPQFKALIDANDVSKLIQKVQSKAKEVPIKDYMNQWNTEKHDVVDPGKRPDKQVSYKKDDGTKGSKAQNVNRVPIALQKKIVNKAVTFLFGNEVDLVSQPEGKEEQLLLDAIKKVFDDNKIESQNRVVAKQLFKSTQVCEIWWAEKAEQHEDYGFPTNLRLRMSIFSPWNGDKLYPTFDDRGNMIAFSRQFVITDEDGKETQCFETYTSDFYYRWKQDGSTWVGAIVGENGTVTDKEVNLIGRIPVIYAEQDLAEWSDVQRAIDRIESVVSKHADTNDYFGDPMLVGTGDIVNLPGKEDAGKFFQIEVGGDLKFLSWEHAPESVKMEIENLYAIIHQNTQTPEMSFESVKGLGAISGLALRFLFMDAHLKVMDKREIFDPYLKRRINLIKAFIAYMNKSLKQAAGRLAIKPVITPYTILDELEKVQVLTMANGGKPIISQKASVDAANMVSNQEDDYKQILEETKNAATAAQYEI